MSLRTLAAVLTAGADRVIGGRRTSVYLHTAPHFWSEEWRIYRNTESNPPLLFVTIDTPTHAVIACAELIEPDQ